ncbi:MAG TPA: UDP-N-acetylglucosamine 2-epimerase (non-hydrolyzing) [Thermoplasmata archaeon]
MKVLTILGTRPEIIRLSRVIPLLDRHCQHILLHTGQNYDKRLSDIFFEQMNVREPDRVLDCRSGTAMEEIGKILTGCEEAIAEEQPDKVLILGDTNSGLSAMVAKRHGVPVFHMEAGNRCFDDRVPEEINRRIIDHCSDILMPYTERSRKNLMREGITHERIFVTGNPILEVILHYRHHIDASTALEDLKIEKGNYFLATLHRSENVDEERRLGKAVAAFNGVCKRHRMPLIWSVHPRTRSRLRKKGYKLDTRVKIVEPLGFFDFLKLEENAACVLTDSGTVQEECCILKIPNVTVRDVTERPETVEVGSNILSGVEPDSILRCVDTVLHRGTDWQPPPEYLTRNVSGTVARIVLGHMHETKPY